MCPLRHGICIGPEPTSTEKLRMDVSYYWGQIPFGSRMAAIIAAFGSWYSFLFGGEWVLVLMFLFLDAVDIVFGCLVARKNKNFSPYKFKKVIVKLTTYGTSIVIFGVLTAGIKITSGFLIPIVDYFVLLLCVAEAVSIFNNMKKLRVPVPEAAIRIVELIGKKASDSLECKIGAGLDKDKPDHGRHERHDRCEEGDRVGFDGRSE